MYGEHVLLVHRRLAAIVVFILALLGEVRQMAKRKAH